ncbi:hypothetical protein Tco_0970881, partial [Tanacetum coccineum]
VPTLDSNSAPLLDVDILEVDAQGVESFDLGYEDLTLESLEAKSFELTSEDFNTDRGVKSPDRGAVPQAFKLSVLANLLKDVYLPLSQNVDVDNFKRCCTSYAFDVGTVLRDFLLHRSSINNSARLSNKFGGFYFSFKFGISGLLHHVVMTIADRIRGGSLLALKCLVWFMKYYANVRRTVADFSHAPLNEYSPSPDDKKQWSLNLLKIGMLVWGKLIQKLRQKGVYEESFSRHAA